MEWLHRLDIRILLYIQEHIRGAFFHSFWKRISFLGDKGWFWIFVSSSFLMWRKTRWVGMTGLLSLVIGVVLTNLILKNVIARPRPFSELKELLPLIRLPRDYSFPSGHTCASFSSALIYYKMLPKEWGITFLILASLIGFSRMYLGVHYPSDILGGIFAAVISSVLAYYLMECFFHISKQQFF